MQPERSDLDALIVRLERNDIGDANHTATLITRALVGPLPESMESDQARWRVWHRTYRGLSGALNGSLDAALTLVPAGYLVTGLTNGTIDMKYLDVREFTGWEARLSPVGGKLANWRDESGWPYGFAPTPALALVIAALRTRSAANSGEGKQHG